MPIDPTRTVFLDLVSEVAVLRSLLIYPVVSTILNADLLGLVYGGQLGVKVLEV